MAIGGRDVLRLIVDADSSGAIREFDKLGRQVKSTVGDVEKNATGLKGKLGSAFDGLAAKSPMVSSALQKMGISGQQAGAMIATAIPAAGIAAGAAIGAFVAKGVSDFQKIALAAGKFSDASGLSVEQASKWIEVADHIGVSETAVSSAFRRMGVAIGNNTKGWQDLNVQVQKNADGSVNLSDTFLKVVTALQKIEDPTQRAAAAQKLFGKGYAEVAELIGRSAPELADMLNEVGEAKIITPEELEKARAFRGAMDDLGDAVQEVGIVLGQSLVPQLTKLANFGTITIDIATNIGEFDQSHGGFLGTVLKSAEDALNPIARLSHAFDDVQKHFGGSEEKAKNVAVAFDALATSASSMGDSIGPAGSSFDDFARGAEIATDMNTDFGGSADAVAQNVGDEASALRDANDALAEHTNATLAAFDSSFAIAKSTNDFAKALLEAETKAQDSTKSAGELQAAYDDETQAAVKVAEAHVRLAQDTAKAEGKTLSAKDAQNVLISSLQAMAAQASGPSRDALVGLIAKLQETGAQNPKPTVSLNDQASPRIASIRATLTAFGNMSVEAAARVTADTSAADRALQGFLSRVRNSNGMVVIGGLTRAAGGPIPGNRNQPVPVMAHGGEYVLSSDVVDRIKKGGPSKGAMGPGSLSVARGGGGGTVVNLNGTFLGSRAEFGRIVDEALAESRRRGNRAS